MNLGLKGKNALVTGGSHGIGLAVAKALAAEGCNVAICARSKPRLSRATRDIREMGVNAMGIASDVLKPADIKRVVARISDSWHSLHILVNNVGGGGRWGKEDIEETSESVWTEVYSKNAMAAVRFTRLVLPMMKSQNWGRVITISSIHGREAGGRPWFSMAKSAEIALMKSLAKNKPLVKRNITFNSVAPGSIMIPGTGWEVEMKLDPSGFNNMLSGKYPLSRLGTPDEVASVVVFLCSEQASLVNGACIVVDGGESSSL